MEKIISSMSDKKEDLFEISNQINELFNKAIAILDKTQKKNDYDDDDENTDKAVDNSLREVSKIVDKIKNQFLSGLGQMYEGVLIKEKLSVRRDGLFPYRCQSELDFDTVMELFLANRTEVFNNLGPECGGIVFGLMDNLAKENILDTSVDYAEKEMNIEPFQIFDFDESRGYSSKEIKISPKGNMLSICKIIYDRGYTRFLDIDGNRLDGEIIRKICRDKYKQKIEDTKNNILKQLELKKVKLNEMQKAVEDKLGKYLVVSKLNEEKSMFSK